MTKYSHRRLSPSRLVLLLILLLSLFLNIFGVWWGLLPGSPVDWGSDTIAPNDILDAARQFFSNGWHSRYPPFHYQLLTLLYSPMLALYVAGLLDIHSQAVYLFLFYLGRMLSLVMSVAVVFLVYRLVREMKLGYRAAIVAVAITILNPLFVFYSKTTNLEIPYITWLMASFVYLVRASKSYRRADYIFFAIFATFAVCTKDQAYGFYVLLAPIFFYNHWAKLRRDTTGAWEAWVSTVRTFLSPLFVAVFLFIVIYNFPFNYQGFVAHMQLIVGPASVDYRIYPGTVSGHFEMAIQSVHHMIFVQGWPLFLGNVIGTIMISRRQKIHLALFIPLLSIFSYYVFFISVIGYNYDRFFLPVSILLSPYGGAWIAKFLNIRNLPGFLKRFLVLAVLIFSFLYAASVDTLLIADSRYQAHRWMQEHIGADDRLYGIGKPYYLPPFFTHPTKRFDDHPSWERLVDFAPDYIIVSSIYDMDIFPPGSEEHDFFKRLHERSAGYELVFQHQGKPLFNFLKREGIFTNLDKVNPGVLIFRKMPGE